jgi:beta-glucosidase
MSDEGVVEDLLARLTLAEKTALLIGAPDPDGKATGYVPGVERVGIPPLSLVDGPLGVADGTATAFPATIALGASWDPDLARRLGAALAAETRAKGHHVLLAPGINIVRVPTCGRNFEYLSEDPRLTGALGAAYVTGLEDNGAAATVKHYVANNQERYRNSISVDVDERTLREVYLQPFADAVDAGASAVMAGYNRVDDTYMTEHWRLLRNVLKDEWGFDGIVVSDWWATHDTVAAAEGGLDVEMPGVSPVRMFAPKNPLTRALYRLNPSHRLGIDPPLLVRAIDRLIEGVGQPDPNEFGYFGDALRAAVERGAVPESLVDEKVRRLLGVYRHLGLLDGHDESGDWTVGHADLAREVSVRGTVILENDETLPLDDERVAVVGPNADRATKGGGSSHVTATRAVSALDGIRSRAPAVRFERGVQRIRDSGMFDLPVPDFRRHLGRSPDLSAAVEAARDADVAVVVVRDAASESEDRDSMALPHGQNRLVSAVADANDRTVVVCRTSGPIEMPWLDDVAAVVQTWYPGQEDGHALADVLYGEDPGGRLPVTFGREFDDYPVASERRYPGVDGTVHYDEGVFVGHRHFDRAGVDPLFPFGHGESYAAFAYDDLSAERMDDGLRATVTVENTADRPGREVVQAYVSAVDSPVPRPPRELGGFRALALDGGERRSVSLPIPERVLQRYDPEEGWTLDGGTYEVAVGRSSRNLRCTATVDL